MPIKFENKVDIGYGGPELSNAEQAEFLAEQGYEIDEDGLEHAKRLLRKIGRGAKITVALMALGLALNVFNALTPGTLNAAEKDDTRFSQKWEPNSGDGDGDDPLSPENLIMKKYGKTPAEIKDIEEQREKDLRDARDAEQKKVFSGNMHEPVPDDEQIGPDIGETRTEADVEQYQSEKAQFMAENSELYQKLLSADSPEQVQKALNDIADKVGDMTPEQVGKFLLSRAVNGLEEVDPDPNWPEEWKVQKQALQAKQSAERGGGPVGSQFVGVNDEIKISTNGVLDQEDGNIELWRESSPTGKMGKMYASGEWDKGVLKLAQNLFPGASHQEILEELYKVAIDEQLMQLTGSTETFEEVKQIGATMRGFSRNG